jgi:hypothetical protein
MMRFAGIGLLLAGLWTAPAWAQTSFLPVFATPERVYFLDTDTEKGSPPALSILTFVAIDPPLARGISAREMTVSVDCTANTFILTGLVSLDSSLKQVSTDPAPTNPAAIGGAMTAVRDYLCDGKIPVGATRYNTRAEALEAGLRIIAANRTDPARQ